MTFNGRSPGRPPRARSRIGLGSLEWVAWRLPDGELRELLLNAIEAMWAGLIDLRHVTSLRHSPLALKRESCRGPERGVAYVAYKQLKDLRGCLEAAEPASPEASCTIRLARFVLPDRKPFEQWWRAVVERLVAEHPDSEEGPDDVGRPIPRQALVLDVPYRAVDDERLLRDQLKALDATTNPFLVR